MTTDELIHDLQNWNFSQGGPWHSHDRAELCMKQAADLIENLRLELRSMVDAGSDETWGSVYATERAAASARHLLAK